MVCYSPRSVRLAGRPSLHGHPVRGFPGIRQGEPLEPRRVARAPARRRNLEAVGTARSLARERRWARPEVRTPPRPERRKYRRYVGGVNVEHFQRWKVLYRSRRPERVAGGEPSRERRLRNVAVAVPYLQRVRDVVDGRGRKVKE